MDLERIVNELKKERDRLTNAIEALLGTQQGRTGSGSRAARGPGRRRKHRLTPAGRKRLSEMMKKRWAERRRKTA